jgi:hypothetical protein
MPKLFAMRTRCYRIQFILSLYFQGNLEAVTDNGINSFLIKMAKEHVPPIKRITIGAIWHGKPSMRERLDPWNGKMVQNGNMKI